MTVSSRLKSCFRIRIIQAKAEKKFFYNLVKTLYHTPRPQLSNYNYTHRELKGKGKFEKLQKHDLQLKRGMTQIADKIKYSTHII